MVTTHSVLMTVFNREPELLMRTLRSLLECDLIGVQVVVVNDGSGMSYDWAREYVKSRFERGVWFDMPEYEAWRSENGFNNPSRAFNQALLLAEGENLFVMSSDVIVPPRTFRRGKKIDTWEMLWTPFVEDTHGEPPLSGHYCGPNRLFPMPWFLAMSKTQAFEVGGWDESYLGGLCFEDNDFIGRMVLRTGCFMGEWGFKVYHQGHYQDAYVNKEEILSANARNRERTMHKWDGIPFDPEFTPFDVSRRMHKSGNAVHECRAKPEKLQKAVEMTTGLVSEANQPVVVSEE